jgi:endonuclease-3
VDTATVSDVLPVIESYVLKLDDPLVVEEHGQRNPFRVLVSCIISLRTREETTRDAAKRLFDKASTPEKMVGLSDKTIAGAIYPAGFSNTKAGQIRALSTLIIERFNGQVPSDMEDLLSLPGVGRKTANLVQSVAFDIPAICVDTHVHRIMNRLGYVDTKTPEQTEMALRTHLPHGFWKPVNRILVLFGRSVCTPLSPRCSSCPVGEWCERKDVVRSR